MANTNKSIPEKMRLAFEAYNNMPRKNGGNPDPSDTYGLLKRKDRCHTYFGDCVKSDYSENEPFMNAVNKCDIGSIFYNAIGKSALDQQIAVQRALSAIKNRGFTDEAAETVVKYYIEALDWDVSLPSDAVSSESSQSRNLSQSSQSISQPVNTASPQLQPPTQSGNVSIGSQSNAQSINLSSTQTQSSNNSSQNVQLGNNPPTPSGMNAQIPPPYQQPAYQQPAYQQPAYQQPAYQQPSYPQYTTTQVSQYAVPEKKKSPAIWIILILLLIIAGMVYFFFIKNKPAEEGFIAEVVPTETEIIEETEAAIIATEDPALAEIEQDTETVTEAEVEASEAVTTAEPETKAEETSSTEALAVDGFSVTNLVTISDGQKRPFDSQTMQYDSEGKILYYIESNQYVNYYDLSEKTSGNYFELNEGYVLNTLCFNPFNGKLYAIVSNNLNSVLYNVTDNEVAINPIKRGNVARFFDSDKIAICNEGYASLYSLSASKKMQEGYINASLDYVSPIMKNDSFSYFGILFLGSRNDGRGYFLNTVQLIPDASANIDLDNEPEMRFRGKPISFGTSNEDVFYFTSDKDFYRYESNGNSTCLINGKDIQNTGLNYLSDQIGTMLYVSDSCFIVFDSSDAGIKLVGAI